MNFFALAIGISEKLSDASPIQTGFEKRIVVVNVKLAITKM